MIWTRLLGTYSQFYNVSVSAGPDGSVYVAGDTDANLDGDGQSTAHSPESVSQFRGDDGFLSKYDGDGSQVGHKYLALLLRRMGLH